MATTDDVVRPPRRPERPAGLPDRYRLEARLGHGRGHRRYRGWDDVLCRPVVVEILEPAPAGPAVAGLHHAGLAALYDVGTCVDGPFLVLQFVDGPSLADRATRRTLSVPAVLAAGARLADALAYLHAHGVVHGAVRAGAVRFDRTGDAHLLGRVHRPPEAAFGTPAFAARAAGDVAQLGRLLGHCLARPGAGPRRRTAPGVPAGVAALLARASAADAVVRPSARELAAGLARESRRIDELRRGDGFGRGGEPGRVEEAGPARPRPTAHRRIAVVALLGAAVAVLVGKPTLGPGGVAEAPAAPAAAAGQTPGSSGGLRNATVLPAPAVMVPVPSAAAAGAQAQAGRVVRASVHGAQAPRPRPRPLDAAPAGQAVEDTWDEHGGHEDRHDDGNDDGHGDGNGDGDGQQYRDGDRHDTGGDGYGHDDTDSDDHSDADRWS
ncbi:hypothetical protein LWC35_08135 [Pseudonocardia kujensis]|uniref:hypothetical protein n=1 Tax=Pseudonocardia kujensis TaxID=1128675 RepID=UPI001E3BF163|nr:hypothetical protein [Pseudonocardia kujensis]MCE0762881.1 hypothetical protein [Pseudonocardia kujensis]